MEPSTSKPGAVYTCGVRDAEWEFCQPYLLLMGEDAPQREYPLRGRRRHMGYGSKW